MNRKLLTTVEAASYLGVSPTFLERDRWVGARIPSIQADTKAVRYRRSDLHDRGYQPRSKKISKRVFRKVTVKLSSVTVKSLMRPCGSVQSASTSINAVEA